MSRMIDEKRLMRRMLVTASSEDGVWEVDSEATPHPDGDKLVALITDDEGDGYRLTLEFIREDALIPASADSSKGDDHD